MCMCVGCVGVCVGCVGVCVCGGVCVCVCVCVWALIITTLWRHKPVHHYPYGDMIPYGDTNPCSTRKRYIKVV